MRDKKSNVEREEDEEEGRITSTDIQADKKRKRRSWWRTRKRQSDKPVLLFSHSSLSMLRIEWACLLFD
jgi:hypothetical protein